MVIYGRTDYGTRVWLVELLQSLHMCENGGDIVDLIVAVAVDNNIPIEIDDDGHPRIDREPKH